MVDGTRVAIGIFEDTSLLHNANNTVIKNKSRILASYLGSIRITFLCVNSIVLGNIFISI
ncbi:hypothetical protein Avbf_15072 [Armadillidium vulgare]|nr:hypothetical protein Avbf_15072 [Armadillidium vulgare]